MADENAQGNGQQFNIQKIYLKDVSFESPNSPSTFINGEEWKPELSIQINSTNQTIGDDFYEVVLTVTVTAKHETKTAFLVEAKQAGIFLLKGFAEANIAGMLAAYCPETLFPFAREAISDLVSKGGFPQVLLAPVNFNALYTQHLEKQQQAAAEQDTTH